MFSPHVPRYVWTGQWPVHNLKDLRNFPNIENAMAHQCYLEQLSFKAQSLRQWTRMIAERIQDEREYAHNNLAAIMECLAHQVNAWTRPQMASSLQMGQAMTLSHLSSVSAQGLRRRNLRSYGITCSPDTMYSRNPCGSPYGITIWAQVQMSASETKWQHFV